MASRGRERPLLVDCGWGCVLDPVGERGARMWVSRAAARGYMHRQGACWRFRGCMEASAGGLVRGPPDK